MTYKSFISILTVATASFSLAAAPLYSTSALSAADWKAGRIMDDVVMRSSDTMTVAQIQNFLNVKLPACDYNGDKTSEFGGPDTNRDGRVTRAEYGASVGNPAPYRCLKDYYENITTKENNLEGRTAPAGAKSAAEIIHYYAQQYKINPQVIITLLQKEQSLITDDWPWVIQYRSATGYGCPDTAPCSSEYYGFSNQVRWAARMFQAIADNDPNWYSPYIKGLNYIQWNPNSSCGGSSVEVINWTTAALYSYTPYQPNQAALNNLYGSGDGCSAYGNRNFWRLFNEWFGSTQISRPLAGKIISREAFTDELRTQPFTANPLSLTPGSKAYIRIKVQNVGYETWTSDVVKLGTTNPENRSSIFSDISWTNPARIKLSNGPVEPSKTAVFEFTLTAPQTLGSFSEHFNVLAESRMWLHDTSFAYQIDVIQPSQNVNSNYTLQPSQELRSGGTLFSPELRSALSLQGDGNLVLYSNFAARWSSNTPSNPNSRLVMQSDGNLVLYSSTGRPLWASGTDGNPGAYVVLQGDGNLVVYSSSAQPLWATYTTSNPLFTHTSRTQLPGGRLFPGQSLKSANEQRELILQGDGNLVLYNKDRKPLWASGTDGKQAAFLNMQPDGNLVLYDTSYKPLWNSRTAGTGESRLHIQGDGNLVLYTRTGRATWATYTL